MEAAIVGARRDAGGQTNLATLVHGALLLVSVPLLPTWLNTIPLSCLAAILPMTGIKLASPALMKQMWNEGRYQFIPFAATLTAIVFTGIGHTRCGAVSAAVKFLGARLTAAEAPGCQHLDSIVSEIQRSADGMTPQATGEPSSPEGLAIVDAVARENVLRVVKEIRAQSRTLDSLVREQRIAIVGMMYDVVTGGIEFLVEDGLRETE